MLAVVAVVLLLAASLGALAGAQHARGRAQTAADLGALAGAGSLALPPGLSRGTEADDAPCELVRRVVERNDAELVTCDVDGTLVTVGAERRTAVGTARAAATAGPASARNGERG